MLALSVVVSTLKGGTFIFRLLQGNYVVMYIPMVPASTIVVSFGKMLWWGLHLGVSEVSYTLIFL